MIRFCSWCNSTLRWSTKFKGKTQGICLNCLRKHFSDEAKDILRAVEE
jgi:Zn-finger protein